MTVVEPAQALTIPTAPWTWALAALALVPILLLVRALTMRLLGPLFVAETARLARRGTAWWMRAGYATALLIALAVGFPDAETVQAETQFRFARDFAELFLIIQSAAVLLLTPLLFAGAISDEYESRSLDFLLTTHLSAREIVLGKYAARLLAVGSVLLTGLPVLSLTLLFGGVDVLLLLPVFVLTLLTMLSLAALSVLLSVLNRRTVAATVQAGLAAIIFSTCLGGILESPIRYQWERNRQAPAAVRSADDVMRRGVIGHGVIAVASLSAAAAILRRRSSLADRLQLSRDPTARPIVFIEAPTRLLPITDWHPIGRYAIAWKEHRIGRRADTIADALWLYFGVGSLLLAAASFYTIGIRQFRTEQLHVFTGLAALLTSGWCAGLMLQLAACIPREREQQTLESLRAIPLAPSRLLGEILLGAGLRRMRWMIAVVVLLIIAGVSGTFTPLAVLLGGLLAGAQATFAAMLALFVSLFARTTVRSYLTVALVLTALVASTAVLARFRGDVAGIPLADALNPVIAWSLVRRLNGERGAFRAPLAIALLLGIGLYSAAAGIMAATGLRRFRRADRFL